MKAPKEHQFFLTLWVLRASGSSTRGCRGLSLFHVPLWVESAKKNPVKKIQLTFRKFCFDSEFVLVFEIQPFNIGLFQSIPALNGLMSPCQWGCSGGYSCTWICFNIYLSIINFIWYMARYMMRQTCVHPNTKRSTK